MQRSTECILTTHTGSLPRPPALVQLLVDVDEGQLASDDPQLVAEVRAAVAEVVGRQLRIGLSVVNDGEAGKVNYTTYVKERLEGFGGADVDFASHAPEIDEFPDFFAPVFAGASFRKPACVAPVFYRGQEAVAADIANLQAALAGTAVDDAFLSSASPGVITVFLANRHYRTDEEYLFALAEEMKKEYDAIHGAGLVLQLDCPDLAMGRHMLGDQTLDAFRARIERHVEALNHATRDIPPEAMRMHLCWGNYEGPHIYDVALADIFDIVLRARPAAISFEGANPRHEHEWRLFEETELPEDKLLIPGVIDSTTNYVEHPRLVADRIVRFARLVGRERVIAGTDCGFATVVHRISVDPAITWTKIAALADGAKLATSELW
jgi:5-methyltetrahydropteroyltriglutamate--homocysteine methyltransferase